MDEIIDPSGADLFREAIIIIFGLIMRAIEKRKLKKQLQDAQ
jgi:hypothetical protein